MPELPEIALTKEYIDSTCLNKKITILEFPQTSLLKAPQKEFEALRGKSFLETQQLGKYLFLKTGQDLWLGFHFGMTGKLIYYQNQETPKYSHLIIGFDDRSHLAYCSRRKLGKIYLTSSVEDFQKEHSLGKDALDLNQYEFLEVLKDKKGMIKTVLTDQHEISGIGNVYADEMLYQCSIHPKTGTDELTEEEKKELFKKMGQVLKIAIENDGERGELPEEFITPHRKDGEDCPKCSGKIKKIKVGGRSTYFCPSCQIEK